MAKAVDLINEKTRLRVSTTLGDIVSRVEETDIAIKNIERKARAEGWEPALAASFVVRELESLISFGRETMASVATSGTALGAMYEMSDGNINAVFAWQGISDGRQCEDCAGLHGQTNTLAEWMNIGVPGSGQTRCGSRCRCTLVPSDDLTDAVLDIPKQTEGE